MKVCRRKPLRGGASSRIAVYAMVTDEDLPAFWREFLDSLGERPGGRWVAEIYRRHRGGSAELTPAEDRSGGRGGGWPTWRSLCSGSASADRPLGQTTGSRPKALKRRGPTARTHDYTRAPAARSARCTARCATSSASTAAARSSRRRAS